MVCPYQGIHPDHKTGKAIICDQCEGRDEPACVAACSTGAIVFVEIEDGVKVES
jgi:Fe-S-cluster-containing hydrogenase component 2